MGFERYNLCVALKRKDIRPMFAYLPGILALASRAIPRFDPRNVWRIFNRPHTAASALRKADSALTGMGLLRSRMRGLGRRRFTPPVQSDSLEGVMPMITDFDAGVFLISLTLSRWTSGSPRDNRWPRIRAEFGKATTWKCAAVRFSPFK